MTNQHPGMRNRSSAFSVPGDEEGDAISTAELDEISECFKGADSWQDDQLMECKKIGFDAGLDYIGEGANRVVMGTENRAYKFTKFDPEELAYNSIYGNKSEVEFFHEKASPELRAHLAAPHDWADDYSWVEFHRYPDEGFTERARAHDLMEEEGWDCEDIHSRNVIGGDEKGDFVIVDYEDCTKKRQAVIPP